MANKANRGDISEARMFTIDQACAYTGMGKSYCRNWCEEIGAVRRFGKMVRYDRIVIDRVFDQMDHQSRKKVLSNSGNKITEREMIIARQMFNDPDMQTLFCIKNDIDPERFKIWMRLINDEYYLELRTKSLK